MPELNNDLELTAVAKWLAGLLMSAALAWATWTTTGIQEAKSGLSYINERLARIETKLDMLMEKK